MNENAGPARGDQISAWVFARRSGWELLVLAWLAGNVVVATLAWFLVGLLRSSPVRPTPGSSQICHLIDGQTSDDDSNTWKDAKALDLQRL